MIEVPRRLLGRHPVAVDTIVAVVLLLIGEAAVATARPGALRAVSTAVAVVLLPPPSRCAGRGRWRPLALC